MKKKFIKLSFFIFSLWGIFSFSCVSSSLKSSSSSPLIEEENSNASNISSSSKNFSKKTREEAFLEVIKVLHAPYKSGDKFFKIFTGSTETNEKKDASEVSVSNDSSIGGKGKWSVKAGKDNEQGNGKDTGILYIYEDFQPKGSKIVINGEMKSTYRAKAGADESNICKDLIIFYGYGSAKKKDNKFEATFNNIKAEVKIGVNGVKDIKEFNSNNNYTIIFSDVLTISGEYQAKLEFVYSGEPEHLSISADDDYEENVMSEFDMSKESGGSYIEFTYDGETKKLTKEEIQKLIIVA